MSRMLRAAAAAAAALLTVSAGGGAQSNIADATTDTVVAAMAAGQAGERYDGYLGLAGPANDQIERAVAATNIKRRSLYLALAQRKGVSPEEVSLMAACITMARVNVGQSYMPADRLWYQRKPGQAAPIPAYCATGTISKSGE